jgi:hypothetical protein
VATEVVESNTDCTSMMSTVAEHASPFVEYRRAEFTWPRRLSLEFLAEHPRSSPLI